MTDRELLEAAAKAAGNGAEWYEGFGMGIHTGGRLPTAWNPLTNDGDAFRLAVEMRFLVSVSSISSRVHHLIQHVEEPRELHELHKGGPCAATRRVIVRAAAAISQAQAVGCMPNVANNPAP